MAYRDRLAASRAQREQPIELSNVNQPPTQGAPSTANGDLSDITVFLAEDTSIQNDIQKVKQNVSQIAALRAQSLTTLDDTNHVDTKIEELTTDTRGMLQDLKERIRRMENTPSRQDAQLRNNRLAVLRNKFVEVIQDYQLEEQESRARSKQRVERQLLIVKPDATREEIAAAVSGGGQQIFSQALSSSTRYGESRAAYREVQERQEDLKRVERTLAELAQLFSDMAVLVEQQDVVIDNVENTAVGVADDTGKALQHTEEAVVHARSYRRGRWICFGIVVLCLVIVAIVLAIIFGRK